MATQQLRESGVGTAAILAESSAARIRPVAASDYAALARFLANFADETRNEQFWRRRLLSWWDDNPAYEEGVARGWLLCANDEIKGFLGNVPTLFQLNKRTVTALSTTTWRVMPQYRNHSLSLLYQAIRRASGSILFDTTPSVDADRVMRGLKFVPFAHCADAWKSIIIVNARRVLSTRWEGKVIEVLGSCGGPILQFLQNKCTRLEQKPKHSEVQVLTHAGSCFDELWDRTRDSYAHTNVRSAQAIQWYCFGNPDFPKTLFGCFAGQRLVGYLILVKGRRDALTTASCVDLWIESGAKNALRDLLSFAKRWAEKEGIDAIEVPHFDRSLGRQLEALRLWQRRYTEEQAAYYKVPGLDELNPAEAYLVGLQGDRGL